MTRAEWVQVVGEVKALWGPSPKWGDADKAYKYASTVPMAAARRAVEKLWLDDGEKHAPSPAAVLSKALSYVEASATRDEIGRYCQREGHMWGIIEEDDDGMRLVICGRCRHQTTLTAERAPTAGEVEDGVFRLTDRVAP